MNPAPLNPRQAPKTLPRPFRFVLAAGVPLQVPVGIANFFLFTVAPADLEVAVDGDTFGPVPLGMTVSTPEGMEPFSRLVLRSNAGGLVRLYVGGGLTVDGLTIPLRALTCSNGAEITADGLALAANPERKELIIKNAGTDRLFVGFGFLPDPANYTEILPGGQSDQDGFGGTLINDIYQGAVYCSTDGGATRFVASELT